MPSFSPFQLQFHRVCSSYCGFSINYFRQNACSVPWDSSVTVVARNGAREFLCASGLRESRHCRCVTRGRVGRVGERDKLLDGANGAEGGAHDGKDQDETIPRDLERVDVARRRRPGPTTELEVEEAGQDEDGERGGEGRDEGSAWRSHTAEDLPGAGPLLSIISHSVFGYCTPLYFYGMFS